MKKEIFYIPNLLSILRILLIFPTAYLMLKGIDIYKTGIIILFFILWISDLLDGLTARKFNQVSELGKIIDPVADKAAIITFAIIIFFSGRLFLWYFILIIARDLLIATFGLFLTKKFKITLMSNYPGKIAVLSIGIILLLSVINIELLNNKLSFLYIVSTIIIIYSLIIYFKRFLQTLKNK